MLNNLRSRIANFISPAKNSMSLPNQFLKWGNRGMAPKWTEVNISDIDQYTGYMYAAIRNRANKVAQLATENLLTVSKTSKNSKEELVHPYLESLEKSPSFTDYQFWYTVSTYLDLEGVYYLMVLRNQTTSKTGTIQEFKLLNPYNVRRVLNKETLKVEGYVESRNGFVRELPTHMIIPMRELNPFSEEYPFAMTDAAKESQFTIKTSGDYTRNTLQHNINAPGIISTDVILGDEDFANFQARVKNNVKGEPIFGNGKGAITWESMNVDLKNAALADVNELNRDTLLAVAGVSKTVLGIEQSGTTRDTARVQKDLLIEGQVVPRIQLIIDALNQDYRNNYTKEFESNGLNITIVNPTATDHDADLVETSVKQKRADLYTGLITSGFEADVAAKYVKGEIDIDELGEPTPPEPVEGEETSLPVGKKKQHLHDVKKNAKQINSLIKQHEGALQNGIVNMDAEIVAACITRIEHTKNAYEDQRDVLTKQQEEDFTDELVALFIGFYGLIFTLQGGESMRDRVGEFALPGKFLLDRKVNAYIKSISGKVSESHINTILDDVLETARAAALEGLGQKEIVALIKKKYNETIVETRAKTIARTETNRAFTRAQFEADRQFIEQNKLKKRAYKKWTTRSSNPCAYCEELASRGPIPFSEAFVDLGDDLSAGESSMLVDFEALEAGNAHPNCSCIYELVIKGE